MYLYKLLWITILTLSISYPAYSDDLYKILEVDKSASQQEVKSAYRKLSKKTHPDLNPDDPRAAEKFIKVTEAYAVLSDVVKRAIYDKTGVRSGKGEVDKAAQRHERAVDRAMKGSNSVWTFDADSMSFYDNRSGERSYYDNVFGSFKTKNNWNFDYDSGVYEDYDVRMKWDPSNEKGWLRDTSNFNNKPLPVNPKNGFVRYLKYEPGTVSGLSEKFDQLLNPILVMRDQRGLYDRKALVQELTGLVLTETQEADLIARANSSIDVLVHEDMKPNFAGDGMYIDAFLTAITNDLVMGRPKVVYRLMEEAKQYHAETIAKIIVNNGWHRHKDSSLWLKAAISNIRVGQNLIIEVYRQKNIDLLINDVKEKIFPSVVIAKANEEVVSQFIFSNMYDEATRNKKLAALVDEFNQLVSLPFFAELVASAESEINKEGRESKSTKYLRQFLEWYKTVDEPIAKIYLDALGLPGVHKNDFWRITDDRTKWYMDEKAYDDASSMSYSQRKDYLSTSLPNKFLKWPESRGITKLSVSTCGSSLK